MTAADLSGCRLYGILDLGYVDVSHATRVARAMITGGVDILQLRAKNCGTAVIAKVATELRAVTKGTRVPLVINDHAAIARDVGADGVHVGQDDGTLGDVRQVVGEHCIVGRSTHTLAQARAADAEGADYLGFGPLFATPTKPDYVPIGLRDVAAAHLTVKRPIFCIGGIKLSNLAEVIAAGARRVVIVSGLLQAADIAEYARSAKRLLTQIET
ncbi:MAG: thiamine phosphate synthase [Verrucomicrobiota bacterium]|nr:thiamine phosphate synthase [Verrucomicrobiota bacterium]